MRELFYIARALYHARRIQDFLWNKPGQRIEGIDTCTTYEGWLRNLAKRVHCLTCISSDNPSWKIEARKRALQLAGVSIAMILAINSGVIVPIDHNGENEPHPI